MATPKSLLIWSAWALLILAITATCVGLVGLITARYVAGRVADAVEAGAAKTANDPEPEATVEIDFYQAAGIRQEDLDTFLNDLAARDDVHDYPALVTLQNAQGDYLSDSRVIVRWESGTRRLLVGKSGVIQFLLTKEMLPGLRIVAPNGYTRLKQRSIPLGAAYEPEQTPDTSHLDYNVVWDGHLQSGLTGALLSMRSDERMLAGEDVHDQLRRRHFHLELDEPPDEPLTPEEIYRRRKETVVVVGHMLSDGRVFEAGGVVLDSSGIIATAYHVIDKPTAIARGVMTSNGQAYPITEILAADKSADVAIVRIDAAGLHPAPLSRGDPEGSPVTIISHPGGAFFSLTQGHVSRYHAVTHFGRVSVMMTVTAQFADGSSGSPVFNAAGAVTGVVSATYPLGEQMVRRTVAPAESIRKLLLAPGNE